MTTAANTETLTAYLADHWVPSALGLVLGPNTQNAGFTSIQVAGTPEQFIGALTMLKAARANAAGAVKSSHTRAIKNIAGAILGSESFNTTAARMARFAELIA